MPTKTDFNKPYWTKKLGSYLAAEWSSRPSHFAQEIAGYIGDNSRILELGAGAGQDGLWFAAQGNKVVITDAGDIAFEEITSRGEGLDPHSFELKVLDITKPFDFESDSFDLVYAQLVLHYFDDDTTRQILGEIIRVLKPGGLLACMVNSTNDPEYNPANQDEDQLADVNGLIKRFFSLESFSPFVSDFETLLFNNQGRTPKDDAIGTSGLIQFIGRKKQADSHPAFNPKS